VLSLLVSSLSVVGCSGVLGDLFVFLESSALSLSFCAVILLMDSNSVFFYWFLASFSFSRAAM